MTKPKAIIVDIDGTLANIDHRRHHVVPNESHGFEDLYELKGNKWFHRFNGSPWKPDWKRFNEEMVNDIPNSWCVELVNRLSHISNPITILFVSGREEEFRIITQLQINSWTNVIKKDSPWKLFMRPTGDYRPDTEIKKEIYETHIKDKYDILFVVDDRKKVVEMWRSLGLTVLQCAEGNY